jgi:hypothetical protein
MRLFILTAALLGLASAANAVTVNAGPLSTPITHVNDFEAMTGPALLPISSYTQDSITITYIGNSAQGGIDTSYQPNGKRSFYNWGYGNNYAEITTPFPMSGMQVALGTGFSRGGVMNFEILKGGVSLLTGHVGVPTENLGFTIYTFAGGVFDKVRFSSTSGPQPIGSWRLDGTSLDDIKVTRAVAAIPEPASWAMLVLGFGAVGAAARRRPRVLAA